jgi:hypothetical protein
MEELDRERQKEKQRADQAEQRADQAKQEADRAKQEADQAKQGAARLADLSRKVLRQQATPEEVQELEHLLRFPPPPAF